MLLPKKAKVVELESTNSIRESLEVMVRGPCTLWFPPLAYLSFFSFLFFLSFQNKEKLVDATIF